MSHHHSFSMRSQQNLIEAMKEEAFAFAKCKVLAQQARKGGNGRLAGTLEKAAEQHYLKHFQEQAELLELFGPDQRKVSVAMVEESFLIDILCKLFACEASQDGDTEVARLLHEMRHHETIQRLQLAEAFKNPQSKSLS
ncbi:MAG TPA: hypothetical protein VI685_27855 [Candidatus Angelobacter sp.]